MKTNGTVTIKLWVIILGAVIMLVSLGMNISSYSQIKPLQERIERNEETNKYQTEFLHALDKKIEILYTKLETTQGIKIK